MFDRPSAAALNHLLRQNNWALDRLARFAGKTARFDIAPFSFAYTILEDGTLRSADASATADAVCVIHASLLPRLALRDDRAQAEIYTEGDASLLAEIFFLSHDLRWDASGDLSHITGDAAAKRVVQTMQGVLQRLHNAAEGLSNAAAAYCTEKYPMLVRPQHATAFMRQVDELRDDVARLEQRIKRLARDH